AHFFADGECPVEELNCQSELLDADRLHVPLPEENAGFNTLARRLSEKLTAASATELQADRDALRMRLSEVVHCRNLRVTGLSRQPLGTIAAATVNGLVFQIGDEWTVPAVEFLPAFPRRTVMLVCDGGRVAAQKQIQSLLSGGATVWAIDPFYFGESHIPQRDFLYGLLVAAVGERPLGIQVDQLRAIATIAKSTGGGRDVELYAVGRRLGLAATVAAALEPGFVDMLTVEGGLTSLQEVIDENVAVNEAPELFCFGLLKECDVPHMEALIAPRPVHKVTIPAEPEPISTQATPKQ
ncbi:MAG: hypothetical protein KDA75_15560, partial [Planctomycetaceae bacterium]|nr:hypothetical protein [Planctomycetaceae bacterium]